MGKSSLKTIIEPAKNIKMPKTHGLSTNNGKVTPEYQTWAGIKNRCYNKRHPGYNNYGGRGITVCDRWRTSFVNFLIDMGQRPSPDHSIERTNSNGNYEPSNCIWATMIEQANNRRGNRIVTINGESKTVAQWCRLLKIKRNTVFCRLQDGWPIEAAIATPVKVAAVIGRDQEVEQLYLSGKKIKEIAKMTDINYQTISSKIRSMRKHGILQP